MTNVHKPATLYVLPLLPQLHQACACVGASYFELQYFIAPHLSSGGHKIIPNSWSKLWHHLQTTVLSPPTLWQVVASKGPTRGATLLSVIRKAYAWPLQRTPWPTTDRLRRSSIIKGSLGGLWDLTHPLYICFVDLDKPWAMLWKIMLDDRAGNTCPSMNCSE